MEQPAQIPEWLQFLSALARSAVPMLLVGFAARQYGLRKKWSQRQIAAAPFGAAIGYPWCCFTGGFGSSMDIVAGFVWAFILLWAFWLLAPSEVAKAADAISSAEEKDDKGSPPG